MAKIETAVHLKWIEEPPAALETRVGRQLLVPCKASGQPEPEISWTKLDQDKEQERFVGELIFNSITEKDAGTYECRARNRVETDLVSRTNLTVLGK